MRENKQERYKYIDNSYHKRHTERRKGPERKENTKRQISM